MLDHQIYAQTHSIFQGIKDNPKYYISSIRCPGVYYFHMLAYSVFIRGRCLLIIIINQILCLPPINTHADGTWRVSMTEVLPENECYQRPPLQTIWTLTIGKELSVQSQDDKELDEHAVAVTKGSQIVGQIHFVSMLCFVFASPLTVILLRGYCASPPAFVY